MADTVLYVCTTCRLEAMPPTAREPGLACSTRCARWPAPEGVTIEPVECLSVCKRPCTVAVASGDRWTYVYGDLDPAESARTILDGVGLYAGTPDGIVPWGSGRRNSARASSPASPRCRRARPEPSARPS